MTYSARGAYGCNGRGTYGCDGREIDDECLNLAERERYTSIENYYGRGICFGGMSCGGGANCLVGASSVWRKSGCCDGSCAGRAIYFEGPICVGRATCYGIGFSAERGA